VPNPTAAATKNSTYATSAARTSLALLVRSDAMPIHCAMLPAAYTPTVVNAPHSSTASAVGEGHR
jgi:hypothetical protein